MESAGSNVEPIGYRLTISACAREFNVSRDTVTRRFELYGVAPVGVNDRNYPVYKILDAAKAILQVSERTNWDQVDPATLHPVDRAQLAKARLDESRRRVEDIKADSAAGTLISVEDCREQLAFMKNRFVQFIDTLPDILERDCELPSDVVDRVERSCDQLRNNLADELTQ